VYAANAAARLRMKRRRRGSVVAGPTLRLVVALLCCLACSTTNVTTTEDTTTLFTTEALNSTNATTPGVTEEPTVDILDDISSWKWAQMGVCGFCSSSMRCCDAIAYGVQNGTLESWKYYSTLLKCNGTKFANSEILDEHGERSGLATTNQERQERVSWCDDYCTVCYADPETSVVSYCQASLEKDDVVAYLIVISFGSSLFFVLCFYVLQILGRRYEQYRNLTVLPMMDSYLQYFSVMYTSLIVLYIITDPENAKNNDERVCCSQNTSLRAMILLVFIATEQVAPLFILLQKSFTRRAFRESFKEALLVAFPYPVLIFVWLTVPLNPLEVNLDKATFAINFVYGIGYAYIVVFLLYLLGRMFLSRQLIRAKPYILLYALPYCIFLATWAGLQLSEKTWIASIVLLISWNLIRLPLIYYCLRRETAFWRREDDGGHLKAFTGAVISDLQSFLDRNRHLLVDYLDVETGSMIGKGTTAEVFLGTYKKNREVAVKRYTPKNITAELLDEFAEEAELMLPFKHRNVANIIGLSVMPPHIILIMPVYTNGSLKRFLRDQIAMRVAQESRRRRRRRRRQGDDETPAADGANDVDDDDDDEEAEGKSVDDVREFELSEFHHSEPFVSGLLSSFASTVLDALPSSASPETSSSSPPASHAKTAPATHSPELPPSKLSVNVNRSSDDLSAGIEREREESILRDRRNILSWSARVGMAIELGAAIEYIHKQNPPILHRDVKPANIMLDKNMVIKLGDFGESTTSFETASTKRRRRRTRRGTALRRRASSFGGQKVGKRNKVRHMMEWERDHDQSWNDLFSRMGFDFCQRCGRHAGWMSATCICMAIFFPIVFVSVLVARSVAFAGFGALIISGLGFVLFTDFYFHNMPRCEGVCERAHSDKNEDQLVRSIRGSPSWMAPEIISGKYGLANYGTAADVYSATVVIWQILSLEKLYPGMERFDIEDFVRDGKRPSIPNDWPSAAQSIIRAGWEQDPAQRSTARELHIRMKNLLSRKRSPSHSLRSDSIVRRSLSTPTPGETRVAGRSTVRRSLSSRSSFSARTKEVRVDVSGCDSGGSKKESEASEEEEKTRCGGDSNGDAGGAV